MDREDRIFPKELGASVIGNVLKHDAIRPYAKILFLTSTLPTQYKELSRSYYRDLISKGKKEYRSHEIAPQSKLLESVLPDQSLKDTLHYLPFGSWAMEIQFTLKKPYISRDDAPFYIIDNPVRKDKVFKVPIVSPSQWKGSLHAVSARQIMALQPEDSTENLDQFIQKRIQLIRMFGNENENFTKFFNKEMKVKEEFANQMKKKLQVIDLEKFSKKGRLRFYPSFFDDIGLEIINPHDRAKKVGINPIYIESVPTGSSATFKVLYVPFDLMGRPRCQIMKAVGEDLKLIANALFDLLTVYGFGAKISSGFGITKDEVKKGHFILNGVALINPSNGAELKEPEVPERVRVFWEKYPDEDFTRKAKEWPGSKKQRKGYREAKGAYEQYKKNIAAYDEASKKPASIPAHPAQAQVEFSFLEKMAKDLISLANTIQENPNGSV